MTELKQDLKDIFATVFGDDSLDVNDETTAADIDDSLVCVRCRTSGERSPHRPGRATDFIARRAATAVRLRPVPKASWTMRTTLYASTSATVSGGAYSIDVPVALAEGAFTVVASATDAAGNSASANDAGTLDITRYLTPTDTDYGEIQGTLTVTLELWNADGTSTGETVDAVASFAIPLNPRGGVPY